MFVFCSHKEACPVAPLEAMACERASVVTGIPAMRDIHSTGETGLVVPPDDIEAFAIAIDSLANNPAQRRRLGVAARIRVGMRFSLNEEARQYQILYSALLPVGIKPIRHIENK
jgi:glycosyltransferase involved in cell wall biosynthesis